MLKKSERSDSTLRNSIFDTLRFCDSLFDFAGSHTITSAKNQSKNPKSKTKPIAFFVFKPYLSILIQHSKLPVAN